VGRPKSHRLGCAAWCLRRMGRCIRRAAHPSHCLGRPISRFTVSVSFASSFFSSGSASPPPEETSPPSCFPRVSPKSPWSLAPRPFFCRGSASSGSSCSWSASSMAAEGQYPFQSRPQMRTIWFVLIKVFSVESMRRDSLGCVLFSRSPYNSYASLPNTSRPGLLLSGYQAAWWFMIGYLENAHSSLSKDVFYPFILWWFMPGYLELFNQTNLEDWYSSMSFLACS
jgi:hypothetical protein